MTTPELTARQTALPEVDADADRQLTTLDGWRRFIDSSPAPPVLLSPGDLEQLSPTARDLYDDDRLGHHARMLTVATSFVEKTVICGRRLVLLNRHAISARRGLMVSGLPGTGKTSAITQLGRSHELLDRARHPNIADRIPVLYITVPPAATARMVAAEFARFLGLPVRGRSNMTDIIEAVVGVCTDTRTGLVLVDEIHNVSQVTRAGGEVSDTLKYFSERIPATFVRRHRPGDQRTTSRHTGRPDRGPLHSRSHPPISLRRRMEEAGRDHGRDLAPARTPAGKPGQAGPLPPQPGRRHDRSVVSRDPQRRDRRHPQRHRACDQRSNRRDPLDHAAETATTSPSKKTARR